MIGFDFIYFFISQLAMIAETPPFLMMMVMMMEACAFDD